MLKLIGELALGALSFVAVKDACDRVQRPLPPGSSKKRAFIHGATDGVAVGCLVSGSALAFPITAPIGAWKVGKAVVENRHEIVEFVKDMPHSAKSTYEHAKAKAFNMLRRNKVEEQAAPSDFASEVALALGNGDFVPVAECVA